MTSYDLIYFALLPLMVAMLVVSVVHPTLVKIARRKHIVDTPNARKLNKVPVPMLGGVGVLCGILFAMGVVGCYGFQQSVSVMVVIALVVMLYTGVGDDILDFRPRWKFALQAFVVMLLIVPVGVSKGAAIRFLAEYLMIPMENTIAVGDAENDIPMIEAAGLGVAMKNASDEIKKYADYITERDNNQGGVGEVIQKYIE